MLAGPRTHLEAAMRAFPDLFFRVARSGVIRDQLGTGLLYVPREAFLGRNMMEVLPEPVGRQIVEALRRALDTRTVQAIEYALEINGVEHEFEARLVPVDDEEGVAVAREITEQKKAGRALQRAREELEVRYLERTAALRERERLFATLGEATSTAIFMYQDDDFLYLNRACEELTGYAREELASMRCLDVVHPEWREVARKRTLLQPEGPPGPSSSELQIVRKDGTVRWVSYSVRTVEHDGRPAFLGVAHDVTELKRAEEQQSFLAHASEVLGSSLDTEATLRTVASLATPVLADWCLVDLVGEDGTARRVAGSHARRERARLVDELVERFSTDLLQEHLVAEVLATGRPILLPEVSERTVAEKVRSRDQGRLVRELGIDSALMVPMRAGGRTLGLISLAYSGSGRRYGLRDLALAENLALRAGVAVENARLFREAQTAVAARERFLALISHEMRTPLGTTSLGIAALRRQLAGDAKSSRTLELVERNVELMRRLVDDLLDLSRISRGTVALQRGPMRLDRVAASALESLRESAEHAGLRLVSDIAPNLVVDGDPHRLEQVVTNLLTNSLKFTPSGGEVRLRASAAGSQVRLVVEDTGVGIPREVLPQLFEMFVRANPADSNKPGLGIGLALVKSIVERHGGRVWAESDGVDRGSRFVIELPADESAGRTAPAPASSVPRQEEPANEADSGGVV